MGEFKSWQSYSNFARRTKSERRFIRAPEDEEFLKEALTASSDRIRVLPSGTKLWRAQLGHDERYRDRDYILVEPCPFSPDRMKPRAGRAKEGRVNPKGIPCLYLSNKKETAMSEVRPWIGALVSVAIFETTKELKLVDFTVRHGREFVFYFEEPDAEERRAAVWGSIDQAFSEPITSQDDVADYVPTQVIAELFKNAGFGGIIYKSVFGTNGYNIAMFNLNDARVTYAELHEVTGAEFRFEDSHANYWVRPGGELMTQTIEILGPADAKEKRETPSKAESENA